MSERPLPKSWKERVRERLAEASKVSSRLTVVPKRNSGPHIAGDTWHLAPQQFQMQAEAEGLLSEKRCAGCGNKIFKSSGELIGNPGRCGPCHGAWQQDEPPSAA
jgi:hypothetical protein